MPYATAKLVLDMPPKKIPVIWKSCASYPYRIRSRKEIPVAENLPPPEIIRNVDTVVTIRIQLYRRDVEVRSVRCAGLGSRSNRT